jgi:hypothetical protein
MLSDAQAAADRDSAATASLMKMKIRGALKSPISGPSIALPK